MKGTPPILLMCSMLLSASVMAEEAPRTDRWEWMVAPYLWAPSVATDVRTTTPPSSASNETSFDSLVDKLDGAFQIHAEGQGDDFGVFADFTYLGLADEGYRPPFRTESDFDARMFELAAVWSPGAERNEGIEVFGGLRQLDLDLTSQLIPPIAFPLAVIDVGKTFTISCLARATHGRSPKNGA